MKDPSGENATVRDFPHLLQLINHVLTTAPHWTDAGHSAGLVGVPVNALLDWPMGTRAGFTVFQDPKVNAQVSFNILTSHLPVLAPGARETRR